MSSDDGLFIIVVIYAVYVALWLMKVLYDRKELQTTLDFERESDAYLSKYPHPMTVETAKRVIEDYAAFEREIVMTKQQHDGDS